MQTVRAFWWKHLTICLIYSILYYILCIAHSLSTSLTFLVLNFVGRSSTYLLAEMLSTCMALSSHALWALLCPRRERHYSVCYSRLLSNLNAITNDHYIGKKRIPIVAIFIFLWPIPHRELTFLCHSIFSNCVWIALL